MKESQSFWSATVKNLEVSQVGLANLSSACSDCSMSLKEIAIRGCYKSDLELTCPLARLFTYFDRSERDSGDISGNCENFYCTFLANSSWDSKLFFIRDVRFWLIS